MTWEEFQQIPVEPIAHVKEKFSIVIGNYLDISITASQYKGKQLCDLLNDIQALLDGKRKVKDRSWVRRELENIEGRQLLSYEELLDVCKQFHGKGYYVAEMLPLKKEMRLYTSYGIPLEERVIAFLDSSVFSSGKYGLAICESGIYWKNDWTLPTSRTYLAWWELAGREIGVHSKYAICLGGGLTINTPGAQQDAISLLNRLRILAEQAISLLAERAAAGSAQSAADHHQELQDHR
ncbi:hypothetical protein [Paenibacillus senegalensis]|uniref:hypothetical protein n=1 Tax=Paenibacillus senegalensis TaxID=1465766 RepID=UPI00028A37C0|nr:hypothetical protein [Paenibacillus senegalensis]